MIHANPPKTHQPLISPFWTRLGLPGRPKVKEEEELYLVGY